MRPRLLVLLPLVAAAPVAVVVLGSGPAVGSPALQAPSSALLASLPDSGPALLRGAVVAASQPATAPVAVARPSTVTPSPVATAAQPASRTRAGVVRRATAPRPVAATSSPTATPAPAKPAPVRTGRDDYPYRTATTNSYDDWGFTKRQCVSFAAWRLAQAGRALNNRADGWGSASNWDDTARRLGKAVTTKPAVGTVAHWQAGESSAYYAPGSSTANGRYAAGSYGHVGWVTHVFPDGSVQVEAYNGSGDRSWSTMRVKAPRFLRL
jgi:surface antigen